ncbi:MAG: DUF58 domain-containing protein [Oscillospiraceae bacterium]|nr:DUF58 domain-containing protein [Oscillospiraceae bacterium]
MVIFIAFGIIAMVIFLQRLIYIKYAFYNLSFSYSFSRTEASEGDIFYITEVVENKKYLPLPAVSTILEVGDGLAFADGEKNTIGQKSVFCFYTVGIYKKITRTWRIKATSRGRFDMKAITVNVRDIFGLVKITKDFECEANVLVLPSAYNIESRFFSLNLTGGTRAVPAGYFSNPFEIRKIAPYTYSEPLNKINWKASAKMQNLTVNEEQPAVYERTYVILDVSEKYHLEKNIKLCATLKKILPEENEISFFSNGRLPDGYFNPLVKFTESGGSKYIESHEFLLDAHEKNFKRLLAEISDFGDDAGIAIEELAKRAKKNIFCGLVIIAKGGKLYDQKSGQTIYA